MMSTAKPLPPPARADPTGGAGRSGRDGGTGRAFGPGWQPDDDTPAVLALPDGVAPCRPALLPARGELAGRAGTLAALRAALAALHAQLADGAAQPIDPGPLDDADRTLLGRILGEGEVSAWIAEEATGQPLLRAVESVFAGVWRVWGDGRARSGWGASHDQPLVGAWRPAAGGAAPAGIEAGAIPAAFAEAALQAALRAPAPLAARPTAPAAAGAVLDELQDRRRRWSAGGPAQVINLSLLPLDAADVAWLDLEVGRGPVTMLSRGYGLCRITSTRLPRTWRVTYFNGQRAVLLDTLEIAVVPEVACAAREDLEDSAARLADVLRWAEAAR